MGSAAPIVPGAPPAPWNPPQIVEVRAGHWVGEGWRIVKSDIGSYVLMTLVFLLLGSAACGLIQGSLIAGDQILTNSTHISLLHM